MGKLSSVVTDLGTLKLHVEPVVEEIVTITPESLYFIWGAPGRGTGDHKRGLALDFMTYELGGGVNSPGPRRDWIGHSIAKYVIANRVRLNVSYVIWNRRIASAASNPPWSWRAYTGSNPHIDHVHVSFEPTGIYQPPVQEDPDVTPEDIEKIAQRVASILPGKVWALIPPNPIAGGSRAPMSTWITYGRINIDQIEGIVREMNAKLDVIFAEDEELAGKARAAAEAAAIDFAHAVNVREQEIADDAEASTIDHPFGEGEAVGRTADAGALADAVDRYEDRSAGDVPDAGPIPGGTTFHREDV